MAPAMEMMMKKLFYPLAPSMYERTDAARAGKAAGGNQAGGGQEKGPGRRIREDYLRKLGISSTKTDARQAAWPAVANTPEAVVEVKQELPTLVEDNSWEHYGASEPSQVGKGKQDEVVEAYMPAALEKQEDAFRINFLRKLSYSKVWVPAAQRPPKSQTVIIFDWDDTLLCTTALSTTHSKPGSMAPESEALLPEIAHAARQLLEMALKLGQTFIITNAMTGWVEYSASRWAPELLPVLNKVHIISARSRYECNYPEIHQWKIQAFLEVRRRLDSKVIANLLSIGDSDFEMEAVHVMGSEFAEALVKTVKFREAPLPEDLLKELGLVASKFDRMVEAGRHLKVCLDRKPPVNAHEG